MGILLDTTFLLPTLGIDVGKEVEASIKKLSEIGVEMYYSRFSILEALWVAGNLMKNKSFDMERFNLGLRSIIRGGRYKKVEEDSKVFKDALELYAMGHKDIIDNLLYASSVNLNLKLLTLDVEFREFIGDKGLKDTLLFPDQIDRSN